MSNLTPNNFDQLALDSMGSGYRFDNDARANLKTSLRELLNSMLRCELPGRPPFRIAAHTADDYFPHLLQDGSGRLYVFWLSNRSGIYDVWYARYLGETNRWTAPSQLQFGFDDISGYGASFDALGNLWAFVAHYNEIYDDQLDIWYERRPPNSTWQPPVNLNLLGPGFDTFFYYPKPLPDRQGNLWVFFQGRDGSSDDKSGYIHYDPLAGGWTGSAILPTNFANDWYPFPLLARDGEIWTFCTGIQTDDAYISYARHNPTTGWQAGPLLTPAEQGALPVATEDRSRDIWLFFNSRTNVPGVSKIQYLKYHRRTDTWDAQPLVLTGGDVAQGMNSLPYALSDRFGNVWVFWISNRSGDWAVWCKRYCHNSGHWQCDIKISGTRETNCGQPHAMVHNGDIWVVYSAGLPNYREIWYKRIFLEI